MRTLNITALVLAKGGHRTPDDGLCLLEAAAYVAGEEHTDQPVCVSPILGAFGRKLNDRLPGTVGDGLDEARGYLALDWLVRTYTPAWLELAGLSVEAAELRALRRIVDLATAQEAGPVVRAGAEKARAVQAAAWDAARSAAWDAARSAAWATAWAAARDAAWVAARDAAEDAARDAVHAAAQAAAGAAAGDAARDAAWAAARDAAWVAARDAARDALKPTVVQLQDSAIALFVQMVEVGR
jgi:hypothetical protein